MSLMIWTVQLDLAELSNWFFPYQLIISIMTPHNPKNCTAGKLVTTVRTLLLSYFLMVSGVKLPSLDFA